MDNPYSPQIKPIGLGDIDFKQQFQPQSPLTPQSFQSQFQPQSPLTPQSIQSQFQPQSPLTPQSIQSQFQPQSIQSNQPNQTYGKNMKFIIFIIPILLIVSSYISSIYFLKIKNISTQAECLSMSEKIKNYYSTLSINFFALFIMIIYTYFAIKNQWKIYKIPVIIMGLCCLVVLISTIYLMVVINKIDPLVIPSKDCINDKTLAISKIMNITSILAGNIFIFSLYFL